MQTFLYSFMRLTITPHDVTPDMARLLTVLNMDAGWQQSFNHANPSNVEVAQVIMILEQKDRHKASAVMIDKPFFGESQQTENSNDILERIIEVTQQGIYRQIRLLGAELGCERFADIITTLIQEQDLFNISKDINDSTPSLGDQMLNGRSVTFGERCKSLHHHDINSPGIDFDNIDNNGS